MTNANRTQGAQRGGSLLLSRAQRDHMHAAQRWIADPNSEDRARERQATFKRLLAVQWALAMKVTHERR